MPTDSMSADQYRQLPPEKPRKYRNKPFVSNEGIRFDSMAEARRYSELKLLEAAGEIEGLVLQPRFPLLINGVKIGEYRGDFQYWDNQRSRTVTEDVKSPATITPVYRIKRKLMLALHGIEIEEVMP